MKLKNGLHALVAVALVAVPLSGFAQGYGAPPPPPPGAYGPGPGQGGWDQPPGDFREFRRQGFADGVQGAQRDFQNHRIWNVKNRDEFRHPPVPGYARNEYREGFKRGYYSAVNHFQGGGPGPR
jgi:hypothetical protein